MMPESGPPGCRALKAWPSGSTAAADLVAASRTVRAEGELEAADALDVAGEREHHRARVALGADLGPLLERRCA